MARKPTKAMTRANAAPLAKPEYKVIDYSGDNASSSLARNGQQVWWDREVFEAMDGVDNIADDAMAHAMVATARAIEKSPQEQERYDYNLLYGSLYEGRELTSLYQYGGQAAVSGQGVITNGVSAGPGAVGPVTWNVIRSVIQTVASQVSRSKPRARFVTSGGTYAQKRRAKKLTTFCDGLFTEAKVYEKTQHAFIHAGVFDVAGVLVYRDGDRVGVDLVRCNEIIVNSNDGIDGNPRSMYRRKFVDRSVILAKPWAKGKGNEDRRAAIMAAPTADPVGEGGHTNLIELYEAWHLPSGPDADDGWHIIALDAPAGGQGGALLIEEYKKPYFPIILFSIDPALSGPYGVSAAATLLPIQMEVNVGLDKIRKGQHLACRPGVWLPLGSKVTKAQISSAVGSTNYYAGNTPPTFYTPTAFSPEVYQQLERHFEKAFSLYGVNTQVAAGTKEAGTTSAVAIRESLDIQTARFAVLAQRWENLHMEIAKQAISIARDIYADNKKMMVSAPGTALLESIDWKDVDLEEDEYVIQVYPTSLLPTTPQGRIDRVNELVSSGIWSPKRGEAALDDLDVESAMSGERASEKNIERICEKMLIEGKYEGPDPTYDLDTCLRIGAQYLEEARIGDVEEKYVDLMYRFLDDTVDLKNKMNGGGDGGQAPSGGAPGGAPPGPGGSGGPPSIGPGGPPPGQLALPQMAGPPALP